MDSGRWNNRAPRRAARRAPRAILGRQRRRDPSAFEDEASRSRSRSRAPVGRRRRQPVAVPRRARGRRDFSVASQPLRGHGRRQQMVAGRQRGRGRRAQSQVGRRRGAGRQQGRQRRAGRRGRNGFMEFMHHHRARIHSQLTRRRRGREPHVTEVARQGGREWRRMHPREKQRYEMAGRRRR